MSSARPPWCGPGDPMVEVRRLEKVLADKCRQNEELRSEVRQLTDQLGQAQAGMEMADLIKRMVSG